MNKLLIILLITCLEEVGFSASPGLVPYTQIREMDVKSSISIGMDTKQVVEKVGQPNLINTETEGEEVWQYLIDPHIVRKTNSSYAGFEVFLKFKKVTYIGIIRATNHLNPLEVNSTCQSCHA